MMDEQVAELAAEFAAAPTWRSPCRFPGGEEIAKRTWNPPARHRGGAFDPRDHRYRAPLLLRGLDRLDPPRHRRGARGGPSHVAGCTGATSEAAVRALYGLPEVAMLDMGDFAGGMLKYLRRHRCRA
jgi:cobalt-precorrin-5B (C1)-methyltransferase